MVNASTQLPDFFFSFALFLSTLKKKNASFYHILIRGCGIWFLKEMANQPIITTLSFSLLLLPVDSLARSRIFDSMSICFDTPVCCLSKGSEKMVIMSFEDGMSCAAATDC